MNNETNIGTKETLCISVSRMAAELGVGITTAYRIIKDSTFYPAKRIGNRIVIDFRQLQSWISEQGK